VPHLSVVIPAYDEARRTGASLVALDAFLQSTGLGYEIVVVDDGSRDGTGEVVRELAWRSYPGLRLVQSPVNRGKGASVRRGMLAATGALSCFCDADLSSPSSISPGSSRRSPTGTTLAVGSRAVPESRLELSRPLHRRLMGRVFNLAAGLPGSPRSGTRSAASRPSPGRPPGNCSSGSGSTASASTWRCSGWRSGWVCVCARFRCRGWRRPTDTSRRCGTRRRCSGTCSASG
jgi:Glycosyl transferase family 2